MSFLEDLIDERVFGRVDARFEEQCDLFLSECVYDDHTESIGESLPAVGNGLGMVVDEKVNA